MRLLLLLAGKTRNAAYGQEMAEYQRRLNRYLPCDIREFKEEKPGRGESPAAYCRRQAPRLLEEFRKPVGLKLLLDERGPRCDSLEFSAFLERALAGAQQQLVFFCGGPFGYDPSLRREADYLISLSPLTFPHELARLLLCEQLYRALTIIRNEPYHY
ncbi:MAG: 23S rRNA (pseudouridine(1915)-N(3))-methyltransferase RlmH [Deltaproteobacteria bacterium]|nr:23S rRNA (pseudouridine(1915)-N(3))-methyltransferase RlmH [Deltaproteobacteria bacterium]